MTRFAFSAAALAAVFALTACGGEEPAPAEPDTPEATAPTEPTTAPAPETPTESAADATTVAMGSFEGRSDHVTTGGVTVVKEDGAYVLILGEDFSLDGAPSPRVGFGNDGEYDVESQLGELANLTGEQRYALPASFDPSTYNEAYIWCEQFAVPLGVASLEMIETAEPVKSGTFEGRSDHVTTGGVTITGEDGAYKLVFADDFSLDGAPSPRVGFGNDGEYDVESQLGELQSLTGGQTYDLPASFDPAAYDEAYVWCEQFAVPLGVAALE